MFFTAEETSKWIKLLLLLDGDCQVTDWLFIVCTQSVFNLGRVPSSAALRNVENKKNWCVRALWI